MLKRKLWDQECLLELENMREKALKAYEAMFSDQETLLIDGVEYRMERTPSANLRFFNVEGYSFLEQNPRKGSHWAKLAREGSLIMWVMKGRRYLGQVRDGIFHDLRKKQG
jgi:hypothetical protein